MKEDIIIVICFVISFIVFCRVWNRWMMKKYERMKSENGDMKGIQYGSYIDNIKELELTGVGADGNSDYRVSEAIKKIKLPETVRMKIDE